MRIGDRIRDKRLELGLSVDELAARLGKNRATVYRYEKGDIENMPIGVLEPLAQVLQTTPSYLIGWTEDAYDWRRDLDHRLDAVAGEHWDALLEEHQGDYSAAWKAWQAEKAEPEESVVIPQGATLFDPALVAPLLGTVRAGLPMYAEENIEGYIPIRQTDGAKYFWLNVRGDSMNAAGLDEGDQILIREQPEAENGQLAVVLVNGNEATVKYFRREGDLVILTPRSFNPGHQPQVYDLKKTPVRVLGLVVECRKVFNRGGAWL